jgi:hypothetical protein
MRRLPQRPNQMVISRTSTGAQRFDPVFAAKDPTGALLERGGYWTATYIREDEKWKIRMQAAIPK